MGSLAFVLALLIGFVGVVELILIAPFPAFALILALAAAWCWWLERHPLPVLSGSL